MVTDNHDAQFVPRRGPFLTQSVLISDRTFIIYIGALFTDAIIPKSRVHVHIGGPGGVGLFTNH